MSYGSIRRLTARFLAGGLPRKFGPPHRGDQGASHPPGPAAEQQLAARFGRYIEWLTAEGYAFEPLGERQPDLSKSCVYLRYDSGPGDAWAAWLLANLHQRWQIPGSFTIAWDLLRTDHRLAEAFLRLRGFDPRYVRLGLYCAPVDNWLRRARFDGDARRQAIFLGSPDFPAFLDRLAGGEGGEELAAIRAGGEAQLSEELTDFAQSFGEWPTIAGRASPLSAAFARERTRRTSLETLDNTFHAVRFLASLDPGGAGFGPEAAALPEDDYFGPHIMFGGGDPETVRRHHHERIWSGAGFVALFPPGRWLAPNFDLLTVPPRFPETRAPRRQTAAPASAPVLTRLSDLVPFGRRCDRVDGREVAAAARRALGPRPEFLVERFVEWLAGEGYVFSDLEREPPAFDSRRVYLRYDVHIQDLLAAYLLADFHESHRIPASFQLTWQYSPAEVQLEPFFRKFLEFDPRYVQVGLHCAPPTTWYIHERCGGNHALAAEQAAGPEFRAFLHGLLAAHRRSGPGAAELVQLRDEIDAWSARLADSFRGAFGQWKTISGHGNFLDNAFAQANAEEPGLSPIADFIKSVRYFRKFGVDRFGFERELTAFPNDRPNLPNVIFESAPAPTLRRWFDGRVAEGLGFLCLFHPATLTSDHLASIVPALRTG